MSEETDITLAGDPMKAKVLLVGAVLGAAVGLGAAYLLVQRAERKGEQIQIGAGDVVKLGLLVFGLLRSVSQLRE
jgi:hypothetical protein